MFLFFIVCGIIENLKRFLPWHMVDFTLEDTKEQSGSLYCS